MGAERAGNPLSGRMFTVQAPPASPAFSSASEGQSRRKKEATQRVLSMATVSQTPGSLPTLCP